MPAFSYHPDILAAFPQTVGGIVFAAGLTNSPTPEPLLNDYYAEQQTVLDRIGSTPLSELEPLAAWRSVFRGFGVNPTKYRSAPESLLRRLSKKGDIPSINLLVDIANFVSIRYTLPVAVFDTRHLQGAVTVHFADGTEHFTPLGETVIVNPDPGEVVFSDEEKLVIARRWCWRQSAESAATEALSSAMITVEAQHETGRPAVEAALADLLSLVEAYAGGTTYAGILDAQTASLSTDL